MWNGTLTIASNDASAPSQVVQLAGYWQALSENNLEPSLATVVNSVFSYQTQLAVRRPAAQPHGRVETAGEEVLSPYWRRADPTKPVTVRQLDAFHTQGNTATIYWYQRGGNAVRTIFTHAGIDGQTVLPRLNGSATLPAAGSFTPTAVFGFKIDTEWSDDTLNDQTADRNNGCTGACGHHVRFWPARDRAGARIADAWIVGDGLLGDQLRLQRQRLPRQNMTPEATGTALGRIDVGATSNYTDSLGRLWLPDTGLFTPSTAPIEGNDSTAIDDTLDDPIYRTYRGNVGNVPQDQR